MKFFRKYRINRLKFRLFVLKAQMAEEDDLERRSGKIYPSVRANQATELASITYRLQQLEAI